MLRRLGILDIPSLDPDPTKRCEGNTARRASLHELWDLFFDSSRWPPWLAATKLVRRHHAATVSMWSGARKHLAQSRPASRRCWRGSSRSRVAKVWARHGPKARMSPARTRTTGRDLNIAYLRIYRDDSTFSEEIEHKGPRRRHPEIRRRGGIREVVDPRFARTAHALSPFGQPGGLFAAFLLEWCEHDGLARGTPSAGGGMWRRCPAPVRVPARGLLSAAAGTRRRHDPVLCTSRRTPRPWRAASQGGPTSA